MMPAGKLVVHDLAIRVCCWYQVRPNSKPTDLATMLKLVIAGAGGRMGQTLTRLVHAHEACEVVGGLEPKGSPMWATTRECWQASVKLA
jgi:hypothetical protein